MLTGAHRVVLLAQYTPAAISFSIFCIQLQMILKAVKVKTIIVYQNEEEKNCHLSYCLIPYTLIDVHNFYPELECLVWF